MNKINQTLRYLSKGFVVMTVFGFLAILVNAAITDLVFFLTDRYNSVHLVVTLTAPLEFAAGLFALMSGLMLFLVNFKVVLANGISRKTFLLANLPIAALAAAALSIFNLLFVQLHRLFWPIILSSELIYPHTGWAGLLILQFTLYFLLIISGWFINLAYYRSTKPFKWLISLAPYLFLGLLQVANARFSGAIFEAIGEYLKVSMGLQHGMDPNPYRASFFIFVYSAVLLSFVYLLIRRAPLKD